ncbi:universal stress protein [Pannus brasiliensis]|uniref:universal stress protein n=1 Tax=Pannus brasiliensis TaxID=1579216 RepID=UPI003BEF0C64
MKNTELLERVNQDGITCQKILVAVDYEDITPEIFDTGLRLAKNYGSEIRVFYSLQKPLIPYSNTFIYGNLSGYGGVYSPEMMEIEQQLTEEVQNQLQTWLDGFVRRSREEGIRATADYHIGEPGEAICRVAEDWGADLIVIGRHARGGISELLLGSVSNYVIHHAKCSVLVVKP